MDSDEVWQAVLEARTGPPGLGLQAFLDRGSVFESRHPTPPTHPPTKPRRAASPRPAPPSSARLPRAPQVAAAMDLFGEGEEPSDREGWECQYCGRQFPFEHLALMQECEAAHERSGDVLGGGRGQRTQRVSAGAMSADPYEHRSVSLLASPSHAAAAARRRAPRSEPPARLSVARLPRAHARG